MSRLGIGRQVSTEAFQAVTDSLLTEAAARRVTLQRWLGKPALFYASPKEMAGLLAWYGGPQGLAGRLIQIKQQDEAGKASTMAVEATPEGPRFRMDAKSSKNKHWFAVRARIDVPDHVVQEAISVRRSLGLEETVALGHVTVNLAKGAHRDYGHSHWLIGQTQGLLPSVVTLEPATIFPIDQS